MGLIANTLKAAIPSARSFAASVPVWQNGQAQLPNNRYETYAREGYSANELVYACIEERATSAAEPRMHVRIGDNWTLDHPILTLLNRPNPYLDAFEMWATIIMHLDLAGNAYALMVRSRSGRVVELWLMRPDRVRVVPSAETYISHYEYLVGDGRTIPLPAADVIHFKTRNPLNDWYGMPPMMAISGRIDIDNYMKDFVKGTFEHGGMPSAVLSIKQKVSPDAKTKIRDRIHNTFDGPGGWHEWLILDNAESTFTPITQSLGTRGLVLPELDEIMEARIPMVYGVPQSLIGTRTSYQNGGYANKRAEATDFWTGTLAPLYKMLAGRLNLRLIPNFRDVSEVAFDMSDVLALREDRDKVHARVREDARAGIIEVQLARREMGYPEAWAPDALFLMPSSSEVRPGDDLEEPDPAPIPAIPARNRPADDDEEDDEDD
jgi:HK97 family phage portal protein